MRGGEQAADLVDGERNQFVILKTWRRLSTGIRSPFERQRRWPARWACAAMATGDVPVPGAILEGLVMIQVGLVLGGLEALPIAHLMAATVISSFRVVRAGP